MAIGLEDFGHVVRAGASSIIVVGPGLRYSERPPPPSLRDRVACVWSSQVTPDRPHVLRTLPDACVELVYSEGRPTLLYGPDASWADVPLERASAHRGIRIRPGAGRGLLGIDISELRGRVVVAEDVLPGRLEHTSAAAWTAAILGRLERARTPAGDAIAIEAAGRLASRPMPTVAGVARDLSVSERHLRRRFKRAIGLEPSTYARIVRMHCAVRAALDPVRSWAEVAYHAGYADQAHLTRELGALTGHTPTRLVPRRA